MVPFLRLTTDDAAKSYLFRFESPGSLHEENTLLFIYN